MKDPEPKNTGAEADSTKDRKLEHIQLFDEDAGIDRRGNHFERIRLIHRGLPELDRAAVDTQTTFLGKTLSAPLLISSMTGGDHDRIRAINRNLATAAQAAGIAMGVGSQRVMFTHPEARASFELREFAPDIPLLANLGAVQLNYGFGIDQARAAVEVLGADALILHFNPLQEAVQPEGDTNFAGLAEKIAGLTAELDVPVIAKEVGAGLSRADGELLVQAGVQVIDVAGIGGTSWSRVEHHRRQDGNNIGLVFQDWGIPTPQAIQDMVDVGVPVIASGGLRNGLDATKALVLGASLTGMASPYLVAAQESVEAVECVIARTVHELETAMFLMGVANIDYLVGNTVFIA